MLKIRVPPRLKYVRELRPRINVEAEEIAAMFIRLMDNPMVEMPAVTSMADGDYEKLIEYKRKLVARRAKENGLDNFMSKYPMLPYLGTGGVFSNRSKHVQRPVRSTAGGKHGGGGAAARARRREERANRG